MPRQCRDSVRFARKCKVVDNSSPEIIAALHAKARDQYVADNNGKVWMDMRN